MLRLELRDRCKRLRNASSCTYVEPQPSTVPLATTRSLANGAVDPASTEATSKRVAPYLTIAQLYRRSTFCLQPGGDTISRKAIVDSLLFGCIPVLFHKGQRALWPWHWGGWVRNATVLFDEKAVRSGELDPIATLEALDAEKVLSMQKTIARFGHRMQYSTLDTATLQHHGVLTAEQPVDAFDLALEGALRLSLDTTRQCSGLKAQQHARLKRGQVGEVQNDPTPKASGRANIQHERDLRRNQSACWMRDRERTVGTPG